MALIAPLAIDGVFVGAVVPLADDGRSSAIAKSALAGAVRLGEEGLAGDAQADRRVHGGAEKALHHFPAEHYACLAAVFPAACHLTPGGLGENISTRGLTENDICIGDVFALGSARIQVAQPRTPCWKIDHRAGCEGVAAHIAEQGTAGWYYRVLRPGEIAAGDSLIHMERPAGAVSLARFWRTLRAAHPSPEALQRLARAAGLNPDWVRKLHERIDWLLKNAR